MESSTKLIGMLCLQVKEFFYETPVFNANSVHSNQTPLSAASDLGTLFADSPFYGTLGINKLIFLTNFNCFV